MNKHISYLYIVMLAVLLFPIADKTMHDFEHFDDVHCVIEDVHYCEAEHICSICDYVSSPSGIIPSPSEQVSLFAKRVDEAAVLIVSNPVLVSYFNLFLRGPPPLV